MTFTAVNRRTFCRLLGGGIVVVMTSKPSDLFGQQRSYPEDLNAYLRIAPDGRVTIFSGKIEMGQGINTSLPQMAAEELGVSLDVVDIVMGDTDLCPWDAGTWGSLTTRRFGPALRAAAAEARTVLMNLAAKRLGVPREQLVVENGVVSVAGNPSKKVAYGELAQGKQIARLVDEKATLKAMKDFKIVGKPMKRLDGREKVTGAAKFSGDIRRPGMLYARLLRPPMHGATRKSLDLTEARKIDGVIVVEQDDLVAVLHRDPEMADRALRAVKAEWERPAAAFDTETVADYFLQHAPAGEQKVSRGDVDSFGSGPAVVADRPRLFESTYRTGYAAHAPIEPHTAVAEMIDGRMTVWAGTQSPFGARTRIAETLGVDEKDVRVITPFLGGGFGGKSPVGQGVEAARLAKLTGKPVMVAWTRGEEFFYDTFDPAAVVKVRSALGDDGKIVMWDYNVYAAGDRAAEVLYDPPNARVVSTMPRGSEGAKMHPFAIGSWRAPGAGTNVFARESQIDIMAAAAGMDPVAFRLKNTSDPRARSVIEAAAKALGWKAAPGPSGKGRGIAVGIDSGTYAAIATEIGVDRTTGAITVNRVVAAQDMGQVINPEGAKMQMEGCVAMGLGYVLSEELRFNGGEILDMDLGSYEIPRFSWMPKIETVIVPNDELSPQGGGEPAIVPMGAAIANALFDLTGVRMYRLPMTPDRVLAALKEMEQSKTA